MKIFLSKVTISSFNYQMKKNKEFDLFSIYAASISKYVVLAFNPMRVAFQYVSRKVLTISLKFNNELLFSIVRPISLQKVLLISFSCLLLFVLILYITRY